MHFYIQIRNIDSFLGWRYISVFLPTILKTEPKALTYTRLTVDHGVITLTPIFISKPQIHLH